MRCGGKGSLQSVEPGAAEPGIAEPAAAESGATLPGAGFTCATRPPESAKAAPNNIRRVSIRVKSIRRHDATIRRAGCASHRHAARFAVKPLHQLLPSINHFQRELNLPRRS